MKVGIQELLVVFIVALVVIGPDKLPVYARKLGQALAEFRRFSKDATKEIRESITEPLDEARKPIREALEPVKDIEKDVGNDLKDLQDSFRNIGKEPPAEKMEQKPESSVETL